jgi:hypothetical protein
MPTRKNDIYHLLGYTKPFDPNYKLTSSWMLPTAALGCIRLIFGFYIFTAIIVSYVWFSKNTDIYNLHDVTLPEYTIVIGSAAIGRSFSYFTYLSYYGQGFYFLVAAAHTFRSTRSKSRATWLHSRFPPWLQVLHSVFYSCVTCFPVLVTLTFWCTMYVGPWYNRPFDAWANISIHGLNSVFAMFEIIFTSTDVPPWTHLPILMVILSLYLGLAYLTRLTGGFWVYEWFSPQFGSRKIVVHILAYTAAIVAIFAFVHYIICARNSLLRKNSRLKTAEESPRDDEMETKSTWTSSYMRTLEGEGMMGQAEGGNTDA